MKKVIGYTRVSADGQVGEDKFGLEEQRNQILEYCARNDMEVIRWFTDEGESGAKERPGFDEIIYGEVSNPPYEAVVVAKSDRVARDINVYYYYKMMLKKKEVQLISVAEDFGQFGVFASMLEAFTLCVAEMERENIMKRTSGGRRQKAKRGGYAGGKAPMGYRAEKGKLIIVPKEAEVVRFIFSEREAGNTMLGIVDKLNSRSDLQSRSGRPFALSTVQGILNNENTYRGMYRYGKGADWVKGEQEPILPPKEVEPESTPAL